jgi:NAD(P)-dependent dehydrogenase (short-subunit alcohol dehydrogenase family)
MLKIPGCVALVTGGNRGLGRAYCEGLLRAGAAKVYAAARDASTVAISDSRVVPVALDIISAAGVASAARNLQDVSLLVNNAGVLRNSPMLGDGAEQAARLEIETNYFGMLSMVQRFAPVLAANGGGAIINVLSVASWFTNPLFATYCASKAAAEVLTDAIRMQLRSQGTRVVGVYAGYIDTDMAAHVASRKTSPAQVVERTLAGLESGVDRVFADERATYIDDRVRNDRAAFYAELQQGWDAAPAPDPCGLRERSR